MDETTLVTPGRKLGMYAQQRGDATAVTLLRLDGGRDTIGWDSLDRESNALARRLAKDGVTQGDFVAVGLPNSLEHVIAAQAAWKLGACVMPVGVSLPAAERDHILRLGGPRSVVADWPDLDAIRSDEVRATVEQFDDEPLGIDPVPQPYKAVASGGSTGTPKLIVTPGEFAFPGGVHPLGPLVGLQDGDVFCAPGPLYHNQAFIFTAMALYSGATVVLAERFRANMVLAAIEELGIANLNVVPTMMIRMVQDDGFSRHDLSSLRLLVHMAAPCPDWAKQAWIDRIGAERVLEMWSATEVTGITLIRGDEWLERPGSVGKPVLTEIRIIGENGEPLGVGEVGEIYSKLLSPEPTYTYIGSEPLREVEDGLVSVGDLGWLDADGYLFLADRRTDLIISGGANIYPAEVEQALSAHPGVHDVVVIGLRDDDLGRRAHAIIVPNDAAAPPSVEELDAFCRERLVKYKCPRSYEFVVSLPRSDAGKIRRSALRAEREPA